MLWARYRCTSTPRPSSRKSLHRVGLNRVVEGVPCILGIRLGCRCQGITRHHHDHDQHNRQNRVDSRPAPFHRPGHPQSQNIRPWSSAPFASSCRSTSPSGNQGCKPRSIGLAPQTRKVGHRRERPDFLATGRGSGDWLRACPFPARDRHVAALRASPHCPPKNLATPIDVTPSFLGRDEEGDGERPGFGYPGGFRLPKIHQYLTPRTPSCHADSCFRNGCAFRSPFASPRNCGLSRATN